MNKDDIQQRLSLLPDGLAEENLQTWQYAIQYYQQAVEDFPEVIQHQPEAISDYPIYKHLLDLVQTISKSGQEKLFRVNPSLSMLIISVTTAMEKDYGDLFIVVDVRADNLPYVAYSGRDEVIEFFECQINEIMPTLLRLLDRLWNETRGKNNV